MKKKVFLLIASLLCLFVYLLAVDDNRQLPKPDLAAKPIKKQSDATRLPNKITVSSDIDSPQTKTVQESSNKDIYILECKETDEFYSQYDKSPFNEQDYVRNALQSVDTFSTRLAVALAFSKEASGQDESTIQESSNIPDLIQLHNEQPNNKLLNYFLLTRCLIERDKLHCSDELINRLVEVDSHNGALWLNIADRHAQNNNIQGAISALENVYTAIEFNSYYVESIELFDNALLSIGMDSELERSFAAIGYSAALPLYGKQFIYRFCEEKARERADLAQSCIDAGKRQAVNGKSVLSQSLGFTLQEKAYKGLGNFEKEAELQARKRNSFVITEEDNKASRLMMYDQELFRYWFKQLKLFGEKESFRLATEEAIRLSSDPDYNPCWGVSTL